MPPKRVFREPKSTQQEKAYMIVLFHKLRSMLQSDTYFWSILEKNFPCLHVSVILISQLLKLILHIEYRYFCM